MTKRRLMAAATISVLVFAFPACQSTGKYDMPHPTDTSAVAPSKGNLARAYPTSNAAMAESTPPEPTAREMGCWNSKAWHPRCDKAAEMCIYKFKVDEVSRDNPQKLTVSYPPSVWEQSNDYPMRDMDREAEKKYRTDYDIKHSITIKRNNSPVNEGKIYLFTRCTDSGKSDDFTLGEVQPDEKAERGGPQQSAQ